MKQPCSKHDRLDQDGVLRERCGLGCVPFMEGRNNVTHSPELLSVFEGKETMKRHDILKIQGCCIGARTTCACAHVHAHRTCSSTSASPRDVSVGAARGERPPRPRLRAMAEALAVAINEVLWLEDEGMLAAMGARATVISTVI